MRQDSSSYDPEEEIAPLSDETFRNIRDWIYEKCGMYFPDKKKYLVESRLRERLVQHGFSTYEEYYLYLRGGGDQGRELEALYNQLTTGETYFFRNREQLRILRQHILPELQEQGRCQSELRLASAGCSTGEEPYSLAILLKEMEQENLSGVHRIWGMDISSSSIEKAQKGEYASYSVKELSKETIQKYFHEGKNDCYQVGTSIRSAVTFLQGNLIEDEVWKEGTPFHVILCRNVLIYLGDEARRTLLHNIYEHLVDGGYLIAGQTESLREHSRLFQLVSHPETIIYKKE